MRSIMDSIGSRLDEARDTGRYLVGLLVFLGLLGTFWGLLDTIQSVGSAIDALDTRAADNVTVFDDLKTGLAAPLRGMGTAFSSSLLGPRRIAGPGLPRAAGQPRARPLLQSSSRNGCRVSPSWRRARRIRLRPCQPPALRRHHCTCSAPSTDLDERLGEHAERAAPWRRRRRPRRP